MKKRKQVSIDVNRQKPFEQGDVTSKETQNTRPTFSGSSNLAPSAYTNRERLAIQAGREVGQSMAENRQGQSSTNFQPSAENLLYKNMGEGSVFSDQPSPPNNSFNPQGDSGVLGTANNQFITPASILESMPYPVSEDTQYGNTGGNVFDPSFSEPFLGSHFPAEDNLSSVPGTANNQFMRQPDMTFFHPNLPEELEASEFTGAQYDPFGDIGGNVFGDQLDPTRTLFSEAQQVPGLIIPTSYDAYNFPTPSSTSTWFELSSSSSLTSSRKRNQDARSANTRHAVQSFADSSPAPRDFDLANPLVPLPSHKSSQPSKRQYRFRQQEFKGSEQSRDTLQTSTSSRVKSSSSRPPSRTSGLDARPGNLEAVQPSEASSSASKPPLDWLEPLASRQEIPPLNPKENVIGNQIESYMSRLGLQYQHFINNSVEDGIKQQKAILEKMEDLSRFQTPGEKSSLGAKNLAQLKSLFSDLDTFLGKLGDPTPAQQLGRLIVPKLETSSPALPLDDPRFRPLKPKGPLPINDIRPKAPIITEVTLLTDAQKRRIEQRQSNWLEMVAKNIRTNGKFTDDLDEAIGYQKGSGERPFDSKQCEDLRKALRQEYSTIGGVLRSVTEALRRRSTDYSPYTKLPKGLEGPLERTTKGWEQAFAEELMKNKKIEKDHPYRYTEEQIGAVMDIVDDIIKTRRKTASIAEGIALQKTRKSLREAFSRYKKVDDKQPQADRVEPDGNQEE